MPSGTLPRARSGTRPPCPIITCCPTGTRKRAWWTRALRKRSALVLELARQFGAGRGGSPLPPLESGRIRVLWPPMLPKDDVTEVQNQIRLVGAGLRSHRTAMDALGTENPEEELARVQADRAALGETSPPTPLLAGEGSGLGGA